MVGFSATVAMPAKDMAANIATDMAARTAAACAPASCEGTLHNGGLRHREDQHGR